MRRRETWVALALATIALSACTPFFYGGVVVFGPADETPSVEEDEGRVVP